MKLINNILSAESGCVLKRISDGYLFGQTIVLGNDFSTGAQRQDLPEYYEEVQLTSEVSRPPYILTKYQFLARLTNEERIAIFSSESLNPMVKMWMEMFRICEDIDLTDSTVTDGVGMLVMLGIVAENRLPEILAY